MTATLKAGSPEADREAAVLAAQGVSLDKICARFDPLLSPQAAKAAVARGRHALDQEQPKPVAPAKAAPPVQPTKPTVPLEADELLSWAEQDGTARARTLASRVRMQLAELGALHDKHAQTTEMRRFVAVLEKNLADAKAELRRLTSDAAAPAPSTGTGTAPDGKQERAAIRAWARENGHQLGDRGSSPAPSSPPTRPRTRRNRPRGARLTFPSAARRGLQDSRRPLPHSGACGPRPEGQHMPSGPEHYAEAERLLALACDEHGEPPMTPSRIYERYYATAQVHATLALAAAAALQPGTVRGAPYDPDWVAWVNAAAVKPAVE